MEVVTRPAWNPARQCTATNRAGDRCRRQPIPGGEVCVMHGGAAPQVQKSAKAKLLAGADLAIDYLIGLLTPKPPCPQCGRSDVDRDPVVVRACQLVLDRSGFHPTLTVEQVAPPNEFADLTEDELIDTLEAMLVDARASRALKQQPVIDVVPEENYDTASSEPLWSRPLGDITKDDGSDETSKEISDE